MSQAMTVQARVRVGQEVGRRLATEPGVRWVYVSGSVAAGLGTSTSDVDIIAVVDDEDCPGPRRLQEASHRVEVEFRPRAWLYDALSAVEDVTLSHGNVWDPAFSLRSLNPAIHVLLGIPVVSDEESRQVHHRLTKLAGKLRCALIFAVSAEMLKTLDDLLGAHQDHDEATAELLSRTMLLLAAQAFLFGCGDYYPGEKWTLQKLRRSGGSFPLVRFMHLLQGHDDGHAIPVGDLVARRLQMAQTVLAVAQHSGWKSAAAGDWSGWSDAAVGVVRSPEVLTFRADDAVRLCFVLTGREFDISEQELALWALLDGRGPAEAVSRMCALAGNASTSFRESTEGRLSTLRSIGALAG
jgi:predicted nucleotidyltransferase